MRLKNKLLISLVFVVGFSACKKWDDHVDVENQELTKNLLQAISENPALSKFKEYVVQTGVDTILQSSKTFTVWAPTNDALQSLDPSIVGDRTLLKAFVLNHISNQSYFTRNAQQIVRVGMLSGKYQNFTAAKFGEANIQSADKYVKNGVLHTLDQYNLVLPSLWDFVGSTASQYAQNGYIKGLDYLYFDASLAIIDSISSTTGQPIYQPGTGYTIRNHFNDKVYDLRREDREYTYLVITDPGFKLESDSLKPYYATALTATTDSLARWNVVKDLAFDSIYSPNTVPVSKFGVPVPLVQSFVIETKKFSNGVAYILSKVDAVTATKFKTITVEGEFPSGFYSDKTGNTNYRVRYNPVTGKDFMDIFITGHGQANYFSYYKLNELPSMKYNVYGLAVNDFQTGAVTDSVLAVTNFSFTDPNNLTALARLPHVVPLYTATGAYNEVLLGQFTTTSFGTLYMLLRAQGTNPMVLDYLRIVPVP